MNKYAIKATFTSNKDSSIDKYTFYPEVQFDSIKLAYEAINDEYGDLLAEAATLDSINDPELEDFYLNDLEVYEIGMESYNGVIQ